MAIINGKRNSFQNKMVDVSTVLFENINDSVEVTLQKPKLSSDTYVRRHYAVSGSLRVSYPNTEYPADIAFPGDVWPLAGDKDIDNFIVTAVAPNSSYHCFTTLVGRKIEHTVIPIYKDQPFTLIPGEVYVSSVPFTINGNSGNVGTVFSFKAQDTILMPHEDGNIITVTSIPFENGNTVATIRIVP